MIGFEQVLTLLVSNHDIFIVIMFSIARTRVISNFSVFPLCFMHNLGSYIDWVIMLLLRNVAVDVSLVIRKLFLQ